MSRCLLCCVLWFVPVRFLAAQPPSEVEVVLGPGQSLGGESPSFFLRSGRVVRNASGQILLTGTYCSGDPGFGPCQGESNLFLVDNQGVIHRLISDQTRPAGFTPDSLTNISLTDAGQILVADRHGILKFEDGRFRWLVRQGDPAPDVSFQGTMLLFDEFRVSDKFASEAGRVVFGATLSNGASGVFAADGLAVRKILVEGEIPPGQAEPLPGGSLLLASPVAAGALSAFLTTSMGLGNLLMLDDGESVTVAARTGHSVNGQAVRRLGNFDLNSAGELVFEAYFGPTPASLEAQLMLYNDGQLSTITDPLPLPGLANAPFISFSGPAITEFGEIFFGVTQDSGVGGIFCWRAGRVSKIVADGDLVPGGQTVTVTLDSTINILPPFADYPKQQFGRAGARGELAFQARVGEEENLRTLIWRAGSIEIVDLNRHLLPGNQTHVVDSVFPISSGADGRVVLRANLCCDAFRESLVLTGPAQTSRHYLPYFVEGAFPPELSYRTLVRVANLSPYPAQFEDSLERLPLSNSRMRLLGAGLVSELEYPDEPGTGFSRIARLQGGPLGLYSVIQLFRNGTLVSETTLQPQAPLSRARLVVDGSTGSQVGLAISNPGAEPIEVDWTIIDHQAGIVDSGELPLDPKGQVAIFVDQLAGGLQASFLGSVLLSSEGEFLAAGLRLSGLELSTIPVQEENPPRPDYGFKRLVVHPPDPMFSQAPRQLLLGPDDQQAISTQDGRVHVITSDGLRVLYGPEQPLPEATFSDEFPSNSRLVDFGPAGLLFRISPGVGREGLFLWDGNETRRLIRSGEMLPDGVEVFLGSFPEQLAINSKGQIALGTNALFLLQPEGTIAHLFLSTDSIPGDTAQFGSILSVDINDAGEIGFATREHVGTAGSAGLTVAARLADASSARFAADRFERVRITSDGNLYFTVLGDRIPLPIPGPTPREMGSGLFYYDGSLHPMLVSGQALTNQVSVGQVADFFPPANLSSRIQLNRNDELAVFASLDEGSSSFGSFFLLANTTAQPGLLAADALLDPQSPIRISSSFSGLGWNDAGELLFAGTLPGFQDGLFKRLADGQVETILRESGRLDDSQGGEPELMRGTGLVWGLSNTGAAAFDAFTYPDNSRATYLARPDRFHQYWVPHLVSGEFGALEFSSALLIHNPGPTSARVELNLFASSGDRIGAMEQLVVRAGETRRLDLEPPQATAGWARLDIRGGSISAFLRMSIRDENRVQSELTVPAVRARLGAFWAAGVRSYQNRDTGLALINTGFEPTEVLIERLGAGLVSQDLLRLTLPPGGYRTTLLSQLFPAGELDFRDHLFRISSPQPVALFSLEQILGQVTAVPIF